LDKLLLFTTSTLLVRSRTAMGKGYWYIPAGNGHFCDLQSCKQKPSCNLFLHKYICNDILCHPEAAKIFVSINGHMLNIYHAM